MSALGKKLRVAEGGYYAFWCPGCDGCHAITVGPGHWSFDGNAETPTFAPSILVTYSGIDAGRADAPPARCHSFVRGGQIQFLDDCTHALAGKTVLLPDFPQPYGFGSSAPADEDPEC